MLVEWKWLIVIFPQKYRSWLLNLNHIKWKELLWSMCKQQVYSKSTLPYRVYLHLYVYLQLHLCRASTFMYKVYP